MEFFADEADDGVALILGAEPLVEISGILVIDHGYRMDEKKFVKERLVEKLQECIAAATAAAGEEA